MGDLLTYASGLLVGAAHAAEAEQAAGAASPSIGESPAMMLATVVIAFFLGWGYSRKFKKDDHDKLER